MAVPEIGSNPHASTAAPLLATRTPVEVRNHYDGSWCLGFDIAEVADLGSEVGYRLRRSSDGVVLPEVFSSGDVAAR